MGFFDSLGRVLEQRQEKVATLREEYSNKGDSYLISILTSKLRPGADPLAGLSAEANIAFQELKSRGYSDEELRSFVGR